MNPSATTLSDLSPRATFTPHRGKAAITGQVIHLPNGRTFESTVLKCARCASLDPLRPCPSCGGTVFTVAHAPRGGILCARCETGFTRWRCPACGTEHAAPKALGWLTLRSRLPWLSQVAFLAFWAGPIAWLVALFVPGVSSLRAGLMAWLVGAAIVGVLLLVDRA